MESKEYPVPVASVGIVVWSSLIRGEVGSKRRKGKST